MANDFPVAGADILPNMFGGFNDALQNNIQNKQRQQQLDFQKQAFDERRQDKADATKQNFLNTKSDVSKYVVPGAEQYDQWITQKISDLNEKFSTDEQLRNLPPAEFEARYNSEATPIILGGAMVKNKIISELTSANDILSQNKWIDKNKLNSAVYDAIAKNYFTTDEQGQTQLLPISQPNWQMDIANSIANSPNSWQLVSDDAINDYTKRIATMRTTTEDQPYRLNDPNGGTGITKGKLSPFQMEMHPVDNYGFVKQPQQYGIVLQPGTNDQLPDQSIHLMMPNKTDFNIFQKMFNDYAQENKIDVNNMSEADKKTAVSKFGFTLLKGLGVDKNQPGDAGYVKPPKISVTNNNSSGKANPVEDITTWGNNVKQAVANGDATKIKDLIDGRFIQGATANQYDGVELKNGNVVVHYHTESSSGGKENKTETIPPDNYFMDRLVRLNKLIRGADAKVDKANYEDKPLPKPTNSKPIGNVPKEIVEMFQTNSTNSDVKFPQKRNN